MQFISRAVSFLLFATIFGLVAASPAALSFKDVALSKRADEDAILARLQTLKTQTDAILPKITKDALTPLFNQLTDAITSTTTDLAALPESKARSLDKRQSEIADLVAQLLQDITSALEGLTGDLATLPWLGGLFTGLDAALSQLLKGLEGLLAGVLNLVAYIARQCCLAIEAARSWAYIGCSWTINSGLTVI
ncbi:hypothetical protein DL96DRAFT_1709340 [Flagelloscypha sp. PMI_526]|nr:hypothetical protein DL96DRAFT_1709340 [Flagelloscypha sp. PMI_526]